MSTLWFGVTAPSGWVGEKLVLHKLRFHPDLLRPFPPLAKGGLGGVVPARPVTRSSDALSLSVLSHPSRKARRIVLDFQGSRLTPPCPPFARGGKGSLARDVIPSRATKTRVSKPSLQLGQHQLLTGPPSGPQGLADFLDQGFFIGERAGLELRVQSLAAD